MAEKLKITLEVTPREVEMANFCMAQFLNLLKESKKFRKGWGTSLKDINDGESFRKELLNKLFNHEN